MLYKSTSVTETRRHSAMCFCVLKMRMSLLLALVALAKCSDQRSGAHLCPDLCFCAFNPSGAEVACSHNSVTDFPGDALPTNITHLSIQSTMLSNITAKHLSLVPSLEKLQLYHNNLTSLPSDLLSNVPHLSSLDLTGNQLINLPGNIFCHASLRSLVMKNNLFQHAEAVWFCNNSSVTWLDLSGNRLANISSEMFHRLSNLEYLDLSDNLLQEIQPLNNMHHLKILNLAKNKLISLKPATFAHIQKLSQLFLQENQLQELPGTLLQNLEELELLLLNQNHLQFLPTGLLDGKKASFRVIVSGNPWQCDGKMEYLWKWLNEHPHSVFFLEEVTCDRPETLRQKQVISLTGDQLGVIKI